MKFAQTIVLAVLLTFTTSSIVSAQTGSGTLADPYQVTAAAGQSYTLTPVGLLPGLHTGVTYTYYLYESGIFQQVAAESYPFTYPIASVTTANQGLYEVYEFASDDDSSATVYYYLTVTTGVPTMHRWAFVSVGALVCIVGRTICRKSGVLHAARI